MMPSKLLNTLFGTKDGGAVHMQDGGKPPKRGASSLPGYGEGIDDPTTQALLTIRRNLGEAGRAAVGAKPYDETNPTETYRAMQALFNAPTPAAIIPEAAQAAGKATTALSGLGALGVAYHGSPHKFKKFDASKIGTGEGAQAYGHGLYFAENPKVAKEYAINLANRDLANQGRLNAHANAKRLATLAGDPKYAADDIRSVLELNPKHEQAGLLKATLEMLESGDYAKPLKTQGSLYTVDIPDEKIAQMLDWDKPLSQQKDIVKNITPESLGLTYTQLPNGNHAFVNQEGKILGNLQKGGTQESFTKNWMSDVMRGTGQDLYKMLGQGMGKSPAVSGALREAGIPGIQYLDQASRDAKQGTRNFVVFPGEEQNIKMLDINGEPQMAAGGAVNMQNNRKVHISDNPDTMLLELMSAPRMQEGGKLPPGIRRAMAQQRGTVAPIPGIKTPAEFIGGYVGADPRFSVMDPDADALERAYRAGEATSVIGDIVGSISPFATASTLARANALPGAAVVKGAAKKAFTARELKSETNKLAKAIAKDNPKMKPEDVQKRAATIAEKNLTWTKEQKPELEKIYGQLVQAPASASVGERLQNVPEVVSQRARKAEEFLAQPTEPWQPPRPELQAFDRAMIKDAMEGFPGIEQTAFPRYTPPKADLSYIEEIYQDPRNRALIEAQIKRGLPLGGETFYASLYPMKMAALERGIPEEKFNQFIYSTAPASARNSIMNEMAVGQFLRDMNARGLPLDEETVKREMAAFKEKYGKGLPLMPIHREGVKNVLEGNLDLREQLKADIPTNYKIPTYGTQKAGDFGKSVVLDVHEASGQTQGSRFHPYFSEQGGFGSREYGAAEQQMMDIAKGLGLPGGTAQAGRWFGGGELTGLVSPRGDALDLLERQAAYTLNGMGITPTPRNVRNYLLDMIDTGEGVLMPYYSKNVPMPDVRTEKKKGGAVKKSALDSVKRGYEYA
jgi:hypothetical protein